MKIILGAALAVAALAAAAPASAQYRSDRDHRDWDRSTFDTQYGAHGAQWDHRWRRGDRLPDGYAADQRYIVTNYGEHHLRRPTRGYRWVRYGNGYVQARENGYVYSHTYNSRY